ncbi:predicted protein [Arabidopsis lyrata subsp. lyrata]|uniref:Predicted protein n=1 Tax=Arabidopsis lyrata subsp. lyrata TaxID=81972 RepID=D7LQ92_ARALL|nr:predicted protein [Arabidopsis lyrata subsp. lyrata]
MVMVQLFLCHFLLQAAGALSIKIDLCFLSWLRSRNKLQFLNHILNRGELNNHETNTNPVAAAAAEVAATKRTQNLRQRRRRKLRRQNKHKTCGSGGGRSCDDETNNNLR